MAQQTAGMNRVARWLAGVGAAGLSDRELLRRFAGGRDQIAFEALVARHTRMVLGVCRRELTCTQDAEDACQSVFLLLAEKAGRGNWRPSIAGWLYTAARNIARNTRVALDRRSRRESRAALLRPSSTVDDLSGRELLRLLDEELDRLAPHYREPLILCYLEGLTQDEAAGRLALSRSALKNATETFPAETGRRPDGRGAASSEQSCYWPWQPTLPPGPRARTCTVLF